ncbi:MAG: response regulator [Myxococcota bacterium]
MNILIVEDDRTNQALLGFQAEDAQSDVSVVTADNGEEALQRLIQVSPISLILLDLGMPQMDGFEFLARLRATPGQARTPVIVVTARDLSERDHDHLRSMGVRRVFQKGRYDTQALSEAITECAQ